MKHPWFFPTTVRSPIKNIFLWYTKSQLIRSSSSVLTFLSTEVEKDTEETLDPDLKSLSVDFTHLLTSGDAADVQLQCSGDTRKAHRTVLAARSQVFSAMFRTQMAESATGIVDICDMDVEVLDLFLEYVYSGKVASIPGDKMHELYAAADKYSVHYLKKVCSDCMLDALSEDNCCTFLVTADAHHDQKLKIALAASIVRHPKWLDGEEWSTFSEEHPQLAIEVYRDFLEEKIRVGAQEKRPILSGTDTTTLRRIDRILSKTESILDAQYVQLSGIREIFNEFATFINSD